MTSKFVDLAEPETCENCVHRLGPIILMCGNPDSEFYREPVHPTGCCFEYVKDTRCPAASVKVVHNVRDGRQGKIGSWEVEPLVYATLGPKDVGRTVIYQDHGRAEAGTITSWRDGIVFARYSRGDTAAGADPTNLSFGLREGQP